MAVLWYPVNYKKKENIFFGNTKKENTFAVPIIVRT